MADGYATVSIFVIGSEITRGIIGDEHGKLIAQELTVLGYEVQKIVLVPDDGSLAHMLKECLSNTDIIILTGGLGPTSDDVTREIVADLAQVELVEHPEAFKTLFERIGDRIYGANLRQVLIPKNFHVIENTKGTACGFWGEISLVNHQARLYAMPGPPVELHQMLYSKVLPDLAKLSGHEGVGRSEYSCFLTPESNLEEVCLSSYQNKVVWGTRVQEYKISLYLNGAKESVRNEMALLIEKSLGKGILWPKDVEAADIFSTELVKRGLTVACAESCTGGLLGKLLTDKEGSSLWFWGSLVTYANEAKEALLSIPRSILEGPGAVSKECVELMAERVLELSKADVALSISGIAGPGGGSKEKPVGTVWFGFASKRAPTTAVKLEFTTYGRSSVRRRGAIAALLLGYFYINGEELLDIVETWQYI